MRARGRWTFKRGWISRCATETIRSKYLVIIQILVAVISRLITLTFEYHCSRSAERWTARTASTGDFITTSCQFPVDTRKTSNYACTLTCVPTIRFNVKQWSKETVHSYSTEYKKNSLLNIFRSELGETILKALRLSMIWRSILYYEK